ncbi:MAG: tetratricopeptide repeat protein [Deltaproteobacteria bacterium]|nr:tetratricopeptide repeat protein [Deltaproteobacteria bacterium]
MFCKGMKSVCIPVLTTFFISFMMLTACSKKEESGGGAPSSEKSSGDPAKDLFKKAVQHSLKGELDEAIKAYEELLKLNPDNAEVHSNLGFAYLDKGDVEKAIRHQEKALDINPNLANAFYGLGMALDKKGDKNGAIENWREYLRLGQPHSMWWNKAKANIERLEAKTK